MTTICLHEQDLAQARRFNRKLAWAPRFRMRHRLAPLFIQMLLRLSQIGGNRKLVRRGCQVEQRVAEANGLRVPVRILRPFGSVSGVVLDIHGGGWVIGNAAMDDEQNAAMAAACIVAALHRLTPGLSDAERREPPLSPLYGDLQRLPPALMFVG